MYVYAAYPPGVGKPTPGSKDLVAQVARKSSLAKPSNASRKHPNVQKEEKGWQRANRNTKKKSFYLSGTSY
ncbi:hypothetical protein TNCV_2116681 [Trichonephila clavipes]|nr:hypothetical protein TNCV_2116681 [Trichonephila clavipes]